MGFKTENRTVCRFLKLLICAVLLCPALLAGAVAVSAEEKAEPIIMPQPEMFTITAEHGGADNKALLDAYIQRMINASLNLPDEQRRRSLSGESLEGLNRALYDLLRERISEVADGTASSTSFEITVSELTDHDQELDLGPWTAEDLGVSAIFENDIICDDAVDAAWDKLDFDAYAIHNALVADCPYELYWYDKTWGTSISGFSLCWFQDGEEFLLAPDGAIKFEMWVSEDYAAEADYTVDTSGIDTVKAAIQNAQSIVEASASTGENVYRRLIGYRDTICGKVTYNTAAAYNADTPYGDPWQLIYVFDEDPETNVVCEGYSKAFKYLFDLSEFGDDYDCILASGTMGFDTDMGDHMWNVVRMEDGKCYLVDITNCDDDTIGFPYRLFMAASGEPGYDFKLNDPPNVYIYDEKTKNNYSADMLEISEEPYCLAPPYTVSVSETDGGTAESDRSWALREDRVTLAFVPEEDWALYTLQYSYTPAGEEDETVVPVQADQDGVYSFSMPDADVLVTAIFVPVFGTADFTLPAATEAVEESAFEGAAMVCVSVPDGCLSIAGRAFADCGNLRKIRIPASVTSIDMDAFEDCGKLYVYGVSPSAAETFCGAHENCVFVEEKKAETSPS